MYVRFRFCQFQYRNFQLLLFSHGTRGGGRLENEAPGLRTVKEGAQLLQMVSRVGVGVLPRQTRAFSSSSKVNDSGQDLIAAEGNDRTWVLVTQGWPLKGRVTGNTTLYLAWKQGPGRHCQSYHVSHSWGEEN